MSEQKKSWRDELKESRGSEKVGLPVVESIFAKINKETGLAELISKKEGEDGVTVIPSISGYLIGEYSKLSAYNNNLKKGGNSTPYLSKDNIITAFEGRSKIHTGTVDAVREYLKKYFAVASAKSNKVYVLATTKGIKTVETNGVLAMRDTFAIKAYYEDYIINFHPKLYNPSEDWKKGMPDNYKTLNIGMRPAFALASQGIPFTPDIESKMDIGTMVSQWLAFKESIINKTAAASGSDDHTDYDSGYQSSGVGDPFDNASSMQSFSSDEGDELPF